MNKIHRTSSEGMAGFYPVSSHCTKIRENVHKLGKLAEVLNVKHTQNKFKVVFTSDGIFCAWKGDNVILEGDGSYVNIYFARNITPSFQVLE